MISTDVKANKKTRNKRSSGCILQIFITSTFKTLKKKRMKKNPPTMKDTFWIFTDF